MTEADDLRIGRLEKTDDFKAAEDLQRLVWPGSEVEVIPLHLLLTIAQNGGLVLGAWIDDRLVGYLLGFLGTDDSDPDRVATARLKHCSHQLGIHPDYRDRRIGHKLKLAQREAVLEQGIRLATWTYDPLETRNANLNIRHLGGIVRRYKRNQYGEMEDGLNVGLPSDRFLVEWWLTSNRVKQRIAGTRKPVTLDQYRSADLPVLNPAVHTSEGLLAIPTETRTSVSAMLALVQVPTSFQALKRADAKLALDWRLHTREVFEGAFAAGFIVTDFVYQPTGPDGPQGFYVLSDEKAMLGYDDTFGRS